MEIVIEIIVEFLVQLIGEGFAEVFVRGMGAIFGKRTPTKRVLAVFGYIAIGAILGGITLSINRNHFIEDKNLRVLNLILTPVLLGGLMGFRGRFLEKKGKKTIRIDSFGYGFLFAFSFGLVRFLWGK